MQTVFGRAMIDGNKQQMVAEKIGAEDETRTRDIQLGKLTLYQLSYSRPCPATGGLCHNLGWIDNPQTEIRKQYIMTASVNQINRTGTQIMTQTAFSYDDVPYSSFTFPQTRPDRLATLAAFHGTEPADPGNCRVLELGCGDGTNLVDR